MDSWIRVILAAVGGIFLWFAIGELFPAADNNDQLLSVAGYGFAMLALLPWPRSVG